MDVFAGSELELEQRLEIAPGSEHRIDAELEIGAVRLTLREQPGRPGTFGAGLAFVPVGGNEVLRGAGAAVVFQVSGGLRGAGRNDLAGLPGEFTVLLPRRAHELRLWEARMAADKQAYMIQMVGRGGEYADAKLDIEPRVGDVLEVEFGLGEGK